jgi:RimJ/RimL family protein N-acetyltransferase
MLSPARLIVDVPVLETERLKLRGHQIDDFADCAAMWADPNVTRHIRDIPFTEEETWTRLLRFVGHWAMLGFGYWAVLEKPGGRFLGEVGFADYKRDLKPSLKGIPEIGWVFASQAHGRGYATEAVRAVTAWGDAHFGSVRTACIITPENVASIRVAAKCGYQEFQRTTYHGHATVMFVRDRSRSIQTPAEGR